MYIKLIYAIIMITKIIVLLIITVVDPSLSSAIKEDASVNSPGETGKCILPPYPDHGTYSAPADVKLRPGDSVQSVYLNISCNTGYGVKDGKNIAYCVNGVWSEEFPRCGRLCRLNKHPSVDYRCRISDASGADGFRECSLFEPVGTSVRPMCNQPNYYFVGLLQEMKCSEAGWNYIATCTPECGRLAPVAAPLILDGRATQKNELPWHVGIYRKTAEPYVQICAGSLVSTTVVISAAQCFWSEFDRKALPPQNFAVSVGNLYSSWIDPRNVDAQKSEVQEVIIPKRFQGAATNFQDDIAVVMLDKAFVYKVNVRPVCVDFDHNFDNSQLQEGKFGKVAGWCLTADGERASPTLKVVDLPYVKTDTCFLNSPPDYREFLTGDKICSGFTNGTALCRGSSGAGLAFPELNRGVERYYLRGIASVAMQNCDNNCDTKIMGFTHVLKHENFIREHLN